MYHFFHPINLIFALLRHLPLTCSADPGSPVQLALFPTMRAFIYSYIAKRVEHAEKHAVGLVDKTGRKQQRKLTKDGCQRYA